MGNRIRRRKKNLSSDLKVWLLLKKEGPKTAGEIEGETGLAHSTVYRAINLLNREGLVDKINGEYAISGYEEINSKIKDFLNVWSEKHPSFNIVPASLDILKEIGEDHREKENREKVKSIIRERGLDSAPPIEQEDRKKHTDELKELLEKWKNLLPKTKAKGLKIGDRSVFHFEGKEYVFFEDFELWQEQFSEIKNHALFSDLKNHISSELFKTWKDFENYGKAHCQKRREIIGEIEKQIEERMEIRKVEPEKVKEKCDSYDYRLPDEIFQMVCFIMKEGPLEGFIKAGLGLGTINSEDECTRLTFWSSEIHSSQKTKDEIIDIFRDIAFHVEEKYDIGKLEESFRHMQELIHKLRMIFRKYLHMPTFAGCCEYLVRKPV